MEHKYVVSDIHGCYEEYLALLKKINFTEEDHLYILGDVADRGEKPIKVLQDLIKRKNVTYILGNHDFLFHYFIRKLGFELSEFSDEEDKWDFRSWIKDGGIPTVDGFLNLSDTEKKKIYDFIGNASVYETVKTNGKTYILTHAGIADFEENRPLGEYNFMNFIADRIDYSKRYYKDENTFIITGHTPTPLIRKDSKPEIYTGNGHIAIDCGCVYGGKLAAYCMDTENAVYVEKMKEYRKK